MSPLMECDNRLEVISRLNQRKRQTKKKRIWVLHYPYKYLYSYLHTMKPVSNYVNTLRCIVYRTVFIMLTYE
jgi:hypothetical protein